MKSSKGGVTLKGRARGGHSSKGIPDRTGSVGERDEGCEILKGKSLVPRRYQIEEPEGQRDGGLQKEWPGCVGERDERIRKMSTIQTCDRHCTVLHFENTLRRDEKKGQVIE